MAIGNRKSKMAWCWACIEARNSKHETRNKLEFSNDQNPKRRRWGGNRLMRERVGLRKWLAEGGGFRYWDIGIWDLFRISDFGIRIWRDYSFPAQKHSSTATWDTGTEV